MFPLKNVCVYMCVTRDGTQDITNATQVFYHCSSTELYSQNSTLLLKNVQFTSIKYGHIVLG